MATKRGVPRPTRFLVLAIVSMLNLHGSYASDLEERAAALTGTIDWVRQTGEDKVVPRTTCARFLLICGTDGATFKYRSVKVAGGIVRGFMWIGGRTVLLTQSKQRAVYFVLDSSGAIVTVVVQNISDGKERKVDNTDPNFGKLLMLEIEFWQTQTPAGK